MHPKHKEQNAEIGERANEGLTTQDCRVGTKGRKKPLLSSPWRRPGVNSRERSDPPRGAQLDNLTNARRSGRAAGRKHEKAKPAAPPRALGVSENCRARGRCARAKPAHHWLPGGTRRIQAPEPQLTAGPEQKRCFDSRGRMSNFGEFYKSGVRLPLADSSQRRN